MKVRVQPEDFDLNAECQALSQRNAETGALASFIGLVRAQGQAVHEYALELEHYPGMTEKAIEKIVQEAMERFKLLDATVIHRVGRLAAGAQIVLVVTASQHRAAAFQGCEFIMDYLKTQAPFWKKESGTAGAGWVDAKASDDQALERWGVASRNADRGC